MSDQNDGKTTGSHRRSRDGEPHSAARPVAKDGFSDRRVESRSGGPGRLMRRRLTGAVLIGLVVFSVGVASGSFYAPQLAAFLSIGRLSDSRIDSKGHLDLVGERIRTLELRSEQQVSVLTAITNDFDLVRGNLIRLRAEFDNAGNRIADANALSDRVDSLADAVNGSSSRADISSLFERLERLESRTVTESGMEDYRAFLKKEDLDALSNSVSMAQDRILALESEAELKRVGQLTFALSVSELHKSIRTEKPYVADLEAVRALSQGLDVLIIPEIEEALQELEANAVKGIPTFVTLRQRFTSLAGEIVRNANRDDEVDWLDQTLGRLTSIVSIRRTGEVLGQSIEARVARAEQRLEAGHLAAAASEIGNLQGASERIAAQWLADAESKLAAENALKSLSNYALSGLDKRIEPE